MASNSKVIDGSYELSFNRIMVSYLQLLLYRLSLQKYFSYDK